MASPVFQTYVFQRHHRLLRAVGFTVARVNERQGHVLGDGHAAEQRAALGAAFTKTREEAIEQEWLFAWRSMQPQASLNPVTVKLGNLENYAEIRDRDTYLA